MGASDREDASARSPAADQARSGGGVGVIEVEGQSTIPVVVLMGPTASGKSTLALALAGRLPVEIVSVDSAQVYRGMDIGTAKPDRATRELVPHHLVDIIDPDAHYSAARFAQEASRAIAAIRGRGRIPLLVGGTMLYFKALLEGLSPMPAANPAVRREIEARAAKSGWPALHDELSRLDRTTAERLKPTDSQRIQRALEVIATTGVPLSSLHGTRERAAELGLTLAFALMPDRALLHRRIEDRFDAMLAGGLIDEVVRLRGSYTLDADMPSMRCVGYRQVWRYLAGAIDRTALRAEGVAATRQLAKRQFTWLRALPACPIDLDTPEALDTIEGRIVHAMREAGGRAGTMRPLASRPISG